jgi:hypothetical protein
MEIERAFSIPELSSPDAPAGPVARETRARSPTAADAGAGMTIGAASAATLAATTHPETRMPNSPVCLSV